MKKLSDYIFDHLSANGLDTVFMVTGGGAMHLNDSIRRITGLRYICNHNEQASAIAAEGYARVAHKPAIVNVTAGPGGINALNGVFGAFTDSIPMIVISGQAKRETMMSTYNIPGLRQLGDQEVDIVRMASGITKYAVCVTDPESIKYHLQKAMYLAISGRPGPVWLDIPVDVQATQIEPDKLKGFKPDEKPQDSQLRTDVSAVLEKMSKAQRPVLLVSTGIQIANVADRFVDLVDSLGIPVTTAWGHDAIHHDHPQYIGKQGSIGDRPGNFAVQNSDFVLIMGSRMPIRQVSYNWDNFAREAFIAHVEIDQAELAKPTLSIDMPLNYDVKAFIECALSVIDENGFPAERFSEWLNWCKDRKMKYPVLQAHHKDADKPINPYYFMDSLHENLTGDDIIVCGDATACIVTFQTSKIKRGQRMFSNSGCASMGFDVPAAIGAAVANPSKRIICLAGDGSIQMNIQELQTIIHHNLNIKILVLDNDGYLSIKSTQNNFFKGSIGSSPESGVSFPDMVKVGNAYGFRTETFMNFDFREDLSTFLDTEGPGLGVVVLDTNQSFEPKLSSRQLPDGTMISAPLEDMAPFLDEDELKENMIIPTLLDSK